MESRGAGRLWASRVVLGLATLACVATSPARWHLEAKAPPGPGATPGRGQLVEVEASHAPEATLKYGTGHPEHAVPVGQSTETRPPPWAGKAEYFVPPGASLDGLHIRDICHSSSMCSNCEPPPGAFVRVTRVDAINAWHLEATGPKEVTELKSSVPDSGGPAYEVEFEAPPGALHVDVAWTGARPADVAEPSVWSQAPRGGHHVYKFYWSSTKSPGPVGWAPRVIVDGFCRGEGPCAPPAGASIRIISLKSVTP